MKPLVDILKGWPLSDCEKQLPMLIGLSGSPTEAHTRLRRAARISGRMCVNCADNGPVDGLWCYL